MDTVSEELLGSDAVLDNVIKELYSTDDIVEEDDDYSEDNYDYDED
jgi:hypothetical protein